MGSRPARRHGRRTDGSLRPSGAARLVRALAVPALVVPALAAGCAGHPGPRERVVPPSPPSPRATTSLRCAISSGDNGGAPCVIE